MKATDKNMIHIRLEPETLKKLKILCAEQETSMQEFVERLVKEGVKLCLRIL